MLGGYGHSEAGILIGIIFTLLNGRCSGLGPPLGIQAGMLPGEKRRMGKLVGILYLQALLDYRKAMFG